MSNDLPTIFALATAPGRAAVAVVRISGPRAFASAARLGAITAADRRMRLATLRDPATAAMLDQALVVGFPAGGSFTGEATVELHLHGSPAVCRAVLGALGSDPALTPAAPGAFTRQALDNLEAICAVPGIDGIYIGPSDLSLSLGCRPVFDDVDPPAAQAIDRILHCAHQHGLKAAVHNGSAASARARLAMGFDLVTVSSDARILAAGSQQILGEVRAR